MAQAARAKAALKAGLKAGLPPGLLRAAVVGKGPAPGAKHLLTRYRILESPGCRRVVLTANGGNTVDKRAAESLAWKLLTWENNYMVKSVIFHGQPGSLFSTGWDKQAALKDGPTAGAKALRRYLQLTYLLATVSKPTIACYDGEVVGSGMGMGMSMYRISSDDSLFQVTAPSYSWALDSGISFLLTRLRAIPSSSLSFARYLALTGAPLSGRDMIASGLTTHHMPPLGMRILPKRMADLTYEEHDGYIVEAAVCEGADVYYKLDTVLNPDPVKHLFEEWKVNDEERTMERKLLTDTASPGEGGPDSALGEDQEFDIIVDGWEAAESREHDDAMSSPAPVLIEEGEGQEAASGKPRANEVKAGADAAADGETDDAWSFSNEEKVMDVVQKVALKKSIDEGEEALNRDEAFEADVEALAEYEERRERNTRRKPQQQKAETYIPPTTAWWHKNFGDKYEAAWKAQEDLETDILLEHIDDESLDAAEDLLLRYGGDYLPEYITYPERTRLVDGDQVLLSPYDCTLNPAEEFPEFFELLQRVDKCFKGESVEEVVANLKVDGSTWAQDCLKRMTNMSPTSLKLVFAQLQDADGSTLEDSLQMEYRVARRVLESQEYQKALAMGLSDTRGLRQGEVAPWGSKTLQDVSGDEVLSYFAPLPEKEELDLPRKQLDGSRRDVGLARKFYASTTTAQSGGR